MRIALLVFLLVGWGSALQPAAAKEPAVVCGVTFAFIVSPQHELTSFKLYLPPLCNPPGVAVELSAAWKKTACAHFSTTKLSPTYKEGEPPQERFGNYFYRPSRPDVLYPTVNAGSSKRDPVVYIQEAILETTPDAKPHACDHVLEAPRPDA
jgi:hypothetical protein